MTNINTFARVFLISLIGVFLMVTLSHLKIGEFFLKKDISLKSPAVKIDVIDTILIKLEQKTSDFKIKKTNWIIPSAVAVADFEQAAGFGVVDLDTGEIIIEKNFSKRLPIASLTKIMTAVVALDLVPEEEVFTVSKKASEVIPSKVMLKEGEVVTLELLLNSLLIASANDSAEVIKEGIDKKYGGSVFIKAMNEKAKILGLKNTNFTNSQGLDNPNAYSSVEDLAILSEYALKNYPQIALIVAKEYQDFSNHLDRRFYLNNWNGLLGVYPGVSGIKIGNTGKAKYTTVVYSQRETKRLLAVLLGAPGVMERDLWTADLLDIGFSKFGYKPANITKQQLKDKYASFKYWD